MQNTTRGTRINAKQRIRRRHVPVQDTAVSQKQKLQHKEDQLESSHKTAEVNIEPIFTSTKFSHKMCRCQAIGNRYTLTETYLWDN